jgi:hypothetical protein
MKAKSEQGRNPIGTLYIVRHRDGSPLATADLVASFNAVADADDDTNTLDLAKQRIGPRRGWFSRDAKVHFIACIGHLAMASFAEVVLRDKSDPEGPGAAQAFGNEFRVGAWREPDGTLWGTVDTDNNAKLWKEDDEDDPHSQSLEEFLEFDGWHGYDGGQ